MSPSLSRFMASVLTVYTSLMWFKTPPKTPFIMFWLKVYELSLTEFHTKSKYYISLSNCFHYGDGLDDPNKNIACALGEKKRRAFGEINEIKMKNTLTQIVIKALPLIPSHTRTSEQTGHGKIRSKITHIRKSH